MSAHYDTQHSIEQAQSALQDALAELSALPDYDDIEGDLQTAAADAQSLADQIDSLKQAEVHQLEDMVADLCTVAENLADTLDELYSRF
jgi:hypothetical protein